MNQKLYELLAQLRLKGIAGSLEQELQRAEKETIPVSEVICHLLQEEQVYRQNQSLLNRLAQDLSFPQTAGREQGTDQ
jgi:hypothetical protein